MNNRIRILALHPTLPNIKSVTTLVLENLLPVLKTKAEVHMIWFVYRPESIELKHIESDTTILDIHNYKNALDVLLREKPDIVFANADPSLIDYAFSLAAKFLHIPVVSPFFSRSPEIPKTRLVKSRLTALFQDSIPTDAENQKQFMRRGRFFIYKYLFLLRTQKAIRMNQLKILRNFFMLLEIYLFHPDFLIDSRFANTLHWLDSEYYLKPLIDAGFEESGIVITGNPMYDPVFQKLQKLRPPVKKDNKVRVLLLTNGMFEHGFWTRAQRDSIVKDIVTEICKHKDGISLVVKIHPSSEVLSEYHQLIKPIDSTVPIYQKGDVLEFLNDADVVIGFQANSALEYSLISKKPIIICNFYGLKGDIFLEKGLALECTELSMIISFIHKAFTSNPASDQKIDEYIHDYLYKADGKASERLCDAIISLVNKTK